MKNLSVKMILFYRRIYVFNNEIHVIKRILQFRVNHFREFSDHSKLFFPQEWIRQIEGSRNFAPLFSQKTLLSNFERKLSFSTKIVTYLLLL